MITGAKLAKRLLVLLDSDGYRDSFTVEEVTQYEPHLEAIKRFKNNMGEVNSALRDSDEKITFSFDGKNFKKRDLQ